MPRGMLKRVYIKITVLLSCCLVCDTKITKREKLVFEDDYTVMQITFF